MTLLDLLFLLLAVVALVTLLVAATLAVSGRGARAGRLLRRLGAGAAVYLTVAMAVSALRPQRFIAAGQPWCFDDWCLTVRGVEPSAAADAAVYRLPLTISSRALRITQRARGAWIYLVDDHGRRYPPEDDSASTAVPLDVAIGPGESVTTSRTFRLPPGSRPVGLITGHGGSYCGVMNWLVIGDAGCVFGKPTMITLR